MCWPTCTDLLFKSICHRLIDGNNDPSNDVTVQEKVLSASVIYSEWDRTTIGEAVIEVCNAIIQIMQLEYLKV